MAKKQGTDLDFSSNAGHRARLKARFCEGKLTSGELLELALTYAIPRVDVKPLARRLIAKFGSTFQIISQDLESLESIPGIGRSTAVYLKMFQAILLSGYTAIMKDTPVLADYNNLENYCKMTLNVKGTEEFHILLLDREGRLLDDYLHSSGTLDSTAVYFREIIKHILSRHTARVIFVHNHPSGIGFFSSQDIEMTAKSKILLGELGVELSDHLLIANGICYSMKNMFLLK